MPVKPALAGWVRWGWLATTVAMGAALLIMAWVGRQRATAAAETLNRGQSLLLVEPIRLRVRALAAAPDSALADSLLAAHRAAGLRYLAFYDSTARLVAEAGRALGGALPATAFAPRPPSLEPIGARLRATSFVGFARAAFTDGPAGRPRPRPLLLVTEFEPVVARRLAAEATDTLLLSALVAGALVAAALLLTRLSIRQEQIERRLEQQRRLGALGEMSAVLAHEIRNPLASLKGHAQLLAEHLGGSPQRQKAELIVAEARRLEALTSDLLDFARSGPMDLKPTDPAALLARCADEVEQGGFVVRAEAAPSAWRLDEARVRQALTNVLRNARQASPAGTRPEATVGRDNGSLVFTVRDFGAGVPAGDEKKIFSPFYTTRTTGTGLGLAVALRVAELHGGTITASNHPEGGAVFRIALPSS